MLRRRECVGCLLADRGDDLIAVAGLGSSAWDLFAAGDNAKNFGFIGAMGQAAPFALGLAMAQVTQRVVLFTGDGDLLMSLGCLATIANAAPDNLAVVVLDNGVYQETGGQSTATAGPTDLTAIARGAGIVNAQSVASEAELLAFKRLLYGPPQLLFANIEIKVESLPLVFPPSFDGTTAINRLRDAVLQD